MNILVIGSVYPRFEADSEVPWLRCSLNGLAANGCRVRMLAPAYKGLRNHTIDGILVERFRYAPAALEILTHDEGAPSKMANKPWLQLLAIPYILSGALRCFKLCQKERPDIIHAHWPFPHALIAFAAAKKFHIPLVLNFHGAELLLIKKHRWVRPILKFFIQRADAVIANSSFTAQKIKAIYSKEIFISPYGTTLARINHIAESATENQQQTNEPSQKFRILFVGRHIERKGLSYLIEAANLLPAERFEFRIVGQGDLTESLKQKVSQLNLKNVLFTGKLDSEKLKEEYQSANAFVLPAIVDSKGDTEGLGVVLIEAAEAGLPLVASQVGGIPDVIISEKTGLLVPEKNPQALADAFTKLADSPDLTRALVQGAKEHIQKNFTWDAILEKQLALYNSLKK